MAEALREPRQAALDRRTLERARTAREEALVGLHRAGRVAEVLVGDTEVVVERGQIDLSPRLEEFLHRARVVARFVVRAARLVVPARRRVLRARLHRVRPSRVAHRKAKHQRPYPPHVLIVSARARARRIG